MKKLIIILVCCLIAAPVFAKNNNKHKNLPPGLAKKVQEGKPLPPGWQKKLARGEVLDHDIYINAVPVSREVERQYPASKAGTKLLQVENKIIRVMDATRTILDVFEVGN